MNRLQDVLHSIDTSVRDASVIVFTGSTYPLLFFSLLMARLKHHHLVYCIDSDVIGNHEFLIHLQSNFLSGRQLYFLKDLSNEGDRERAAWIALCNEYHGPAAVTWFCRHDDSKYINKTQVHQIQLPDALSYEDYQVLISFFFPSIKSVEPFARSLYAQRKTVSLDTACLLGYYQATLGRTTNQFFDQWLDQLLGQQRSLFTGSQYLFAKDERAFFAWWQAHGKEFPLEFWVAYWSEQLMQARVFLHYAQKNKILEGRSHISRLPFTFLQRDWRRYHPWELVKAHQFLYLIDYRVKNGAYEGQLELFYSKFLLDHFAHPRV